MQDCVNKFTKHIFSVYFTLEPPNVVSNSNKTRIYALAKKSCLEHRGQRQYPNPKLASGNNYLKRFYIPVEYCTWHCIEFCLMRLNQHSIDAMYDIIVRSTSILLKKWHDLWCQQIQWVAIWLYVLVKYCKIVSIEVYWLHFFPIFTLCRYLLLVMDSSRPNKRYIVYVYWPEETKCDDGS